jgi:choline monooxygenase
MFVNDTRLPHVLPPRLYSCPNHYQLEVSNLFCPNWLVVGCVPEAPNHGDFFTRELLGTPILVRNENGQFHTFLNVCPHRHSLLTCEQSGSSPTIQCQYHGWEFSSDGRTGKIPDAQHFRPMPGGPECLQKYPTEIRGPLVFVCLNAQPKPLDAQLKELLPVCEEFKASRWQFSDAWHYDFPVNWKIVVENTVETYHVASVHPKTLVSFGKDSEIFHEIYSTGTIMKASIESPATYRRLAEWLSNKLEPGSSPQYRLHHGFPSLFMIRIDAMLQVMTVTPCSPNACRLDVYVFTLRAAKETILSRFLTKRWGRFKCSLIRKVLAEDARLYPALHKGMQVSPFRGTISTREELVHAFQDYVHRECRLG